MLIQLESLIVEKTQSLRSSPTPVYSARYAVNSKREVYRDRLRNIRRRETKNSLPCSINRNNSSKFRAEILDMHTQ
jgi:hypothetical protein